jgi:phosphoglycerate dehydrogenase-like enzyme
MSEEWQARCPVAVLAGHAEHRERVFRGAAYASFSKKVRWALDPMNQPLSVTANPPHLAEVEVVLATWGMPVLEKSLLDAMPSLRAVFYAAGSVRPFVTPFSWQRGIRIYCAASMNAIPVAEFTFAQILLATKAVPRVRVQSREDWVSGSAYRHRLSGNYAVRVGLISYGAIARLVRERLRTTDHEVVVYDPFLTAEEAEKAGVKQVSLETLLSTSDVVSLHTPLLPETRGWIRGHHLELMREGATLINTSRGAVLSQPELADVMQRRSDLTAILDVLESEPPEEDEPLLKLPNVWIYPHLAGSIGNEYQRLVAGMTDALDAYLGGQFSVYEVREADMARMA